MNSGTMRNGRLSQHKRSAPRTEGRDSGLWPTPAVCGNYNRKGLSKSSGDGLATAVRTWPTPTARDWKSGASNLHGVNARPLNEVVHRETPGPLNPTWVEWLMGFPIGWTDLSVSAMLSSPK